MAELVAVGVPTWRLDLERAARRLATGLVGGLVSGAVVGGVGGRLAMLVLRLTSSDGLRGVETNDGFEIGQFSAGTVFLVLVTAVLGALGGAFYLVVRPWFSRRLRPVVMGLFGATVGGAVFIDPVGVDFELLKPSGLAVALFIVLPATYGATTSIVVDEMLERQALQRLPLWLALAPLVLLLVTGVGAAVVLLVLPLAWVLPRRVPAVARLWHSPATAWVGRAALLAIIALAAWKLADAVVTIV
jgi:hypothetical protein